MADANGPAPEEAMPVFTIYNLPPAPARWDRIGIAFLTFAVAWTVLIYTCMAILLYHRNSIPALRVRSLPLSFTAIAFLHCYWILAWLVYPIGGTMPVVIAYDVQYFFMGIWFPLGIAVFMGANLRFLRVARRQKRWVQPNGEARSVEERDGCNGAKSSWFCKLRNWGYMRRVMSFIGIGMVAQVLLTVGMWAACRKYHPTFGIPGTEIKGDTLPEQMIDLGRGWEWWPSVLWQVIWTWVVAPYLIWKAWNIRDTMGWRTQTIGCCISNLHATPMFLISSYVPAFNKLNQYYPPSQWLHLGIMMIEIFTIFIPLHQLIKHRRLARKAAILNAKWDTQSQISNAGTVSTAIGSNPFIDPTSPIQHHNHYQLSTSPKFGEKSSTDETLLGGSRDVLQHLPLDIEPEEDQDRLLTMSALERVLHENPIPLQDFSALNDFSGENVAFLRRVMAWKRDWETREFANEDGERVDGRLGLYNRAVDIYTDFVSPTDAEFPLNLSSSVQSTLETLFQPALSICPPSPTTPSAVTPFDTPSSHISSSSIRAFYTGSIPSAFTTSVFDAAVAHIKYLVLTNTWPKFVAEMQQRRRRSEETMRSSSVGTEKSSSTIVSKVSEVFYSLLRR